MSELKFYKHHESGEKVASFAETSNMFVIFLIRDNGDWGWERQDKKTFEKNYTPLPEPPKEGSTAWAIMMMKQGAKVCLPTYTTKKYVIMVDDEYVYNDGTLCHMSNYTTWELYEEPKAIIEKLPHEFEKGECVWMSTSKSLGWEKLSFSKYNHEKKQTWEDAIGHVFKYCLPYEGNEHLEGTSPTGEHGAVPAGYVPPHVPKLGDADYWQVGDEVIDLSKNIEDTVSSITTWVFCEKMGFSLYGTNYRERSLRTYYHKGSYVKEDGTVFEFVPTRPHRIAIDNEGIKND